MKVLVVGTGGSIVSGISTAADEMARTLAASGHDVERLKAGERMRRRSNAVNLENVRAVLADAVAVFRRTRRARADAVWIHTFGVPLLPALRALALVAAARVAGRPAVVRFHAFGLERFVAEGGRPLRVALRVLAGLSDAMVVEHQPAATALRGVGDFPVHVLHNWVEVAEAKPPSQPTPPPLRVVFVGGLVRRKGAPQLIEAMRQLEGADVRLRLVGGAGEDGPAAYEQLRAAADDLVRAGTVSFAGEQDAAGVRRELQGAHLFVLPSESEGMPLSMLEAMAEGRAVLVSNAGNMRSVVEDTGCGWVLSDRDPATIAGCLRRIAGDPAALTEASERAWRAAVERFSANSRQDEIRSILASLHVR